MPIFDSFALPFSGATRAGLAAAGADFISPESGIACGARAVWERSALLPPCRTRCDDRRVPRYGPIQAGFIFRASAVWRSLLWRTFCFGRAKFQIPAALRAHPQRAPQHG